MRHHPREAGLGLPAAWLPQGRPPSRRGSREGLSPSLLSAGPSPASLKVRVTLHWFQVPSGIKITTSVKPEVQARWRGGSREVH